MTEYNLDEPEWKGGEDRSSAFASPTLNAAALPAAFGLAWVLNFTGVGLFSMLFYHEFCHGIAAWFCGRYAFPIPFAGFTFWGGERSCVVVAARFGPAEQGDRQDDDFHHMVSILALYNVASTA